MLNAEKYKKEILDIEEEGYHFAVSRDRQNIVRSCAGFTCENCIFGEEGDCCYNFSRMKWLLSEYKEPIKLTRLEYEILKWLDKEGYKFIERSNFGNLVAYDSTPEKAFSGCEKAFSGWIANNELLHFVKWEDGEPTSIKQVLKNCEVVDDDTDKR